MASAFGAGVGFTGGVFAAGVFEAAVVLAEADFTEGALEAADFAAGAFEAAAVLAAGTFEDFTAAEGAAEGFADDFDLLSVSASAFEGAGLLLLVGRVIRGLSPLALFVIAHGLA